MGGENVSEFYFRNRNAETWQYSEAVGIGALSQINFDYLEAISKRRFLKYPAVRVYTDGRELNRNAYTEQQQFSLTLLHDVIMIDTVREHWDKGATVVFQGFESYDQAIRETVRRIERLALCEVVCTAFTTPVDAMGLEEHTDVQDVLVVQTYGEKKWHVDTEGEPTELVLKPGDVLFLPAGVSHAAHTADTVSIHLSLVLRHQSPIRAIKRYASRNRNKLVPDPRFRGVYSDRDNPKLPPSVYAHDLAPEELFDAMLPPAGSDKFADFVKAEYLDVNIRDLTGGLERALSASLMDETSRVRLTEPIETFLEDSHLVIINSAGDPCVKYNRKFYSAVLSLSPDTPIAIKSMRGILSLEAKIGLARGLYVDGLLSLGETA